MIALRVIDPPCRLTGAVVLITQNAKHRAVALSATKAMTLREKDQGQTQTVGGRREGGVKRGFVARMIKMVVEKGGVGQEVLDGLAARCV